MEDYPLYPTTSSTMIKVSIVPLKSHHDWLPNRKFNNHMRFLSQLEAIVSQRKLYTFRKTKKPGAKFLITNLKNLWSEQIRLYLVAASRVVFSHVVSTWSVSTRTNETKQYLRLLPNTFKKQCHENPYQVHSERLLWLSHKDQSQADIMIGYAL